MSYNPWLPEGPAFASWLEPAAPRLGPEPRGSLWLIGFFGESEKFRAPESLALTREALVMTRSNRRLDENPVVPFSRGLHGWKSLSSCHLTKQRLINELVDEVNEKCLALSTLITGLPPEISRIHRKSRLANSKVCASKMIPWNVHPGIAMP